MKAIVCCSRSVLALKLLTDMLSIRLGRHELVEWSLEINTHPYFNPFFHIWGTTEVSSSLARKSVKFDAEFHVDPQLSMIESSATWWMGRHRYAARLKIDGELCYVFWMPTKKFWIILDTLDFVASPSGFYTGAPVMFTGRNAEDRWVRDEAFESFCPQI